MKNTGEISRKLNEMEANKLPYTEYKQWFIRMLKKLSENFNSTKKDRETIQKNKSEMKDTLTKMINNLQGIDSRVDDAENQIRDLG